MPGLDPGIHSVTLVICLGPLIVVMPWLDHGIHSVALVSSKTITEWIAGSSPGLTGGPAMTTTLGLCINLFTCRHAMA